VIPSRILKCLRSEYGSKLAIKEDDSNDVVDFFETGFYKITKSEMTPGMYVRIYRENSDMTQDELGEKIGASKSFICDIEHNRRAIRREMALTKVFNVTALLATY
jgi:DNA-binding XRE family transcriptional regulator